MATIKGKWLLVGSLNSAYTSDLEQSINGTVSGQILINTTDGTYDKTSVDFTKIIVADDNSSSDSVDAIIGVYTSEGTLYVIENDGSIIFDFGSKEQDVSDEFYTFFTSVTTEQADAKPLATITYNGSTIAELNAGETATLSCEGKKMVSDVVVKVNEVESEIPDGYVKPEGTLELVFNNIEAEFPIDCSQYAKVTVNTAEPLKITDPTVLDNITDSPWGVGGSVFLYEGATTDSYENGVLYYLEDTEK